MSTGQRQMTFLRWYLERMPRPDKSQRSSKLLKRYGLLLILGIWVFSFYANYSNPANWDFVKRVYRNPFVILAIAFIVGYNLASDYLEYRIVCKGVDATGSAKETIRVRYARVYGKDVFYQLRFAMLTGSFLCGLIGIIMLCIDLANKYL